MKRRSLRGFFTTSVVATSLLASGTVMAATDMFLKMDGIQGETVDAKHKGEMDVLAWSWGQSTGTARTRRGVIPTACVQDLSLTKYIDSATPGLIMNGMTGQVAPTAVLSIRKAGGTQQEYLRLTMRNVTISSFSTGGSGGEDRLTENVTLHFDSMEGQYQKQKADGSLDAPITWNVSDSSSRGCQ